MNKGALVSFQGDKYVDWHLTNFTPKKIYRVVAGQGDGVPRNNGTLGAFIQNNTQFVVEDDKGNFRVCSIKDGDWKIVREGHSNYKPKPEAISPIVHVKHRVPASALVEHGEFTHGDSNDSRF